MASKTIKGLTVKIGGDTTGLGEALDNVKKKSKNLSGELSEVNKLLKFDPENTELLTQKQKILANSIEDTSAELKVLKEAEKQVQAQFKKGEVSEAQVRALQREIVATTNRLEHYEDEAEKTSKSLKKMDKATDEVEETTEGFGDTLVNVVGAGFKMLSAGISGLIGAMAGSAEASREYRTAMGKLETAFETAGHDAAAANTTYKALQGVLGDTDQAVEASNHLAQLCDNEEELAKWTDIATGVYATFGDSLPIEGLTEAANETAKTGALTGGLADALNWAGVSEEDFQASLDACSTEQERQALITETLNGLYSEAADKYKEVNAEVIRANEANEAWASTVAEVGGAVDPLVSDVKLLGASLLSELLPGVKDVTAAFRGLLNGEEGAGESLGAALSNLLTDVLGKIAELAPTVVQVAVSLIGTLAASIVEMLPKLVETGVQVILTIITGLSEALPLLIESVVSAIDQIIPPLIEALPAIIMALVDGLLALLPALLQGVIALMTMLVENSDDITAAILPLIPIIVEKVCDMIAQNLPVLLKALVSLVVTLATKVLPTILLEVAKMIPKLLSSVVTGLGKIFTSVGSKIVEFGTNAVSKAKTAAKNILDAVVNGIKKLPDKVKQVGTDLVKGLWNGINDMASWVGKKIKGFTDGVLDGIKGFFGIHSPSRVLRDEVGKMLAEGLAEGITDNADAPLGAMTDLSSDLLDEAGGLNGLTLERQISHSINAAPTAAETGILGKLDALLAAIERGQIILLDGDALVGATADRYDNELGQRRVLAARGAI